MKAKKLALMSYIAIFFACVWSCSDTAYHYAGNEYQKTIETFKYQLSNNETYTPTGTDPEGEVLVSLDQDGEIIAEMPVEANPGDKPQEVETQPAQGEKLAFLTFDDGPSPRTGEILDILAKHDVKATFFIISNENKYEEYMVRAAQEGHAIGVHSHSHRYKQIYKSVDEFLKDFTACYNFICEKTGNQPTVFRFPGGSINNFNSSTRRDIVDEMTRRGFVYFDWNVESGDGGGELSRETIYRNIIKGSKGKERAVILMHDSITKKSTVAALDDVITTLKEEGYTFCVLTNEVKPVIFKMK